MLSPHGPAHTLEFDSKQSVLRKGEKPGLDGNLIVEGDNLTQPQFKEWIGQTVGKEGEEPRVRMKGS